MTERGKEKAPGGLKKRKRKAVRFIVGVRTAHDRGKLLDGDRR